MNLMQQHEQVIKEINACYSFLLRIQLHHMLQLFKPRYLIRYCSQIVGPWFIALFLWKKRRDQSEIWIETLDLLSSETEKTSPYYEIIRKGSSPIHHLSEYLANKFSNYNWTDLEKANQLYENVLPKFRLVKVLLGGVNIAAIMTIFQGILDGSLWSLVQQKLIQGNQFLLVALIYIILIGSISLSAFWKRRVRLQRAGNVLKYLTILYPTQRRYNNDAGQ